MLTLTIWSLQYTKSEQSNNEEWLIISFFHYYKHRVQVGILIKKICEVFDVDERLFGDSSMTVEEAVTSHDIISEISARIRSERKEKGWSQTELAKHAGLTTNTIYRIETGQINLATQTATTIASALDVGIDWLMRGNKDRKNYPADQKMIDWLWEHPDVREMIWNMMKNEE